MGESERGAFPAIGMTRNSELCYILNPKHYTPNCNNVVIKRKLKNAK